MTDTFQDTLTNIKNQESAFQSRDEHAVEIGVVLPLLRQVGWNTYNISEIYPQRGLPDGSKVDFDLQIDGQSRLLIEVKTWGPTLNDGGERQLADYCRLAKPSLAVLTSGRYWRLYLPPTKGKSAPLRRFLEFDIVTCQTTAAEDAFRQFLSRDSMSDVNTTVAQARNLFREARAQENVNRQLTAAWNKLADDENARAKLVMQFAQNSGISAGPENVAAFLKSLRGPVVNEVPKGRVNPRPPASFFIPASPTGKRKKEHRVSGHNGWNNLLLEICELMQSRHPETCRRELLSLSDRFAEVKDSKFDTPVGDTGVFTRYGNSVVIRDACYQIVIRFGYRRDSLDINDSSGAIL